jgi:hypothetical protein
MQSYLRIANPLTCRDEDINLQHSLGLISDRTYQGGDSQRQE